jgi:hypothetical protein
LELAAEEHILLLTMHHIVSDGWSVGVLFRELGALYNALLAGEPSPLPPLPIQYADFAAWQREWLQGAEMEEQVSYWKQQLGGAPPVLELPTDRPRSAAATHRGALETFDICPEVTQKLRELSQREGATLFMTLLAGFQTLLHRYTGSSDIVVGTDVANRNRAETEGLIGFFLNHVVLRARTDEGLSFRALLRQVRETSLGAFEHQDFPFDKLVEVLNPERSLTHAPVFQVLFVLQNTPGAAMQLEGLTVQGLGGAPATSKFDLALFITERQEGLRAGLVYRTDLFDRERIVRTAGHLQTLLAGIAENPDAALGALEFRTQAEREQEEADRAQREQSQLAKLRSIRRRGSSE